MRRALAPLAAVGLTVALLSSPLGAAQTSDPVIVVVDTADSPFGSGPNQGWWSPTLTAGPATSSYMTGTMRGERRGFLSFDVSGVTGTIVGARVELTLGQVLSGDSWETLGVWDVSTDATTLNGGGVSAEIYADLGSGTTYGGFAVDTSLPDDHVLVLELNGDGLAALNDGSGWFSVGLSLLTDDGNDSLFASTSAAGAHRLVLDVVENTGGPPPHATDGQGGPPAHARDGVGAPPDHAPAKGWQPTR
ncbi:MAG TPA: hypothetical protein VGA13_03125 [Acidimicrobiales bacterium]